MQRIILYEKITIQLALFGSLILHAILLLALNYQPVIKPTPEVFSVSFVKPSEITPQIVTPSDLSNLEKPIESKLISAEDNSVPIESIKRGSETATSASKQNAPTQKTFKINEAEKNLVNFNIQNDQQKPTQESETTQNNINNLLATNSGSSDFLPEVKDGEITLLNTKASKYAVFVRRVALQVFSELKNRVWALSSSEIKKITSEGKFLARLSSEGSLISIEKLSSSTSEAFDNALNLSVKNNANDPHPIEAALHTDGTFHFIFESTAKSYPYQTKQGYVSDRKWLLLRVGLE